MQLKRLDLIGFKSFAEKTTFEFEAGVTGLVGPNGCGKSNVVDAIKWILGEQSVKSLRGKQMADVIFNGGGGMKGVNAAEASLTFNNSDGLLTTGTEEVSITRRVYLNGQSEYFINKKACRLKDIKTMFLDTGVGVECYSVIEQGRIDQILQASAMERREVFEEAAGVSKYKVRRKEAMAKLERTQANLLRANDIIEEVSKQLRSVKYQAAKARRYREYAEEFKQLRVSYSLNDYHRIQQQLAEWKGREEEVGRQQIELQTRMGQLDAEQAEVDSALGMLENGLEEMQRQLGELRARVAAGDDSVRFEVRRAEEQAELRGKFEQQKVSVAERLQQIGQDLLVRSQQLERARAESEEKRGALADRQGELGEVMKQGETLVQSLSGCKGELIGLMQEAAKVSNELSAIASDVRNIEAQIERLNVRLKGAQAERTTSGEQAEVLTEELSDLETGLQRLEEEYAGQTEERAKVSETVDTLVSELDAVKQEMGSKVSRLEVLKDLAARYEGVESGVRAVLEAARSGVQELSGVLGMLGENINVTDGYAHAVEAALGHRVQALIVRREDDSRQGLQCVREAGGRASFVALSGLRRKEHGAQEDLEGRPGVVGRLRGFVSATGYTEEVVDCLLDGFYVVENLDHALRLRREGTNGYGLVTLQGEVIEPTGVLTGGHGSDGGGLLTRIEERSRLDIEVHGLKQRAGFLQAELDVRRGILTEIDAELARLDETRGQDEMARQEKRHALEVVQSEQHRLDEELSVISSEEAELSKEHERLSTTQAELKRRLEDADVRKEELARRVEVLTGEQEVLTTRRTAVQEAVTELKVGLARSQQMVEGLQGTLEGLTGEQLRQGGALKHLDGEIEQTRVKERQALESAEERRRMLEDLRVDERELSQRLTEGGNQRQEQRNRMAQIDEASRQLKQEASEQEKKASEVQLGLQECRLKMENCVGRVREEYQLDLVELYKDYQPEQVDWQEVAAKIEELRSKLSNLGPVNLDAIHDEESLQERLDFLTTQKNDLEAATHKLEEIIRKINKECRDRFQETFTVIRGHFQDMFRKLFGGGKADIFLENEQDILESGIEIIARPPGKEPRALSLLSGGEKVLTAVALLFAVFKTKPSPFCILDEVDAALDEANVGRFCSVVTEFLDQSQFIIITHSKRTMSIADVLYGITMPTSGVSKKVTVKFEEYEQKVA